MTATVERPTRTSITVADLPALARGAAALGTGGGGDPYIGRLMAEEALRRSGPVALVQLADLPDDALVFPVAMMGAPTVMVEKLPSVDQLRTVVDGLATYLGRRPTHVACIEAGGINSTIPIVAAAQLGLPLVDGDGMGRAFPELQMVLPTLYGVACTPLSIADEKGNLGVLSTIDNKWAETFARSVTIDMGCSAFISNYAMSGATMRDCFVGGTLSLCLRVGEAIEQARSAHTDPVSAVIDTLGGRLLDVGKVVDVQRRTTTGFARGEAVIEGADDQPLVLHFQNEHLTATRGDRVEVTTPDLIIVLDHESGEPITTEALRFGHRVAVVAAPSDPRWHSAAGIDLAGPRYFGYDTEPVRFDEGAGRA